VGVEQLAEQEPLSEAGGKQQPSVGDGSQIMRSRSRSIMMYSAKNTALTK